MVEGGGWRWRGGGVFSMFVSFPLLWVKGEEHKTELGKGWGRGGGGGALFSSYWVTGARAELEVKSTIFKFVF